MHRRIGPPIAARPAPGGPEHLAHECIKTVRFVTRPSPLVWPVFFLIFWLESRRCDEESMLRAAGQCTGNWTATCCVRGSCAVRGYDKVRQERSTVGSGGKGLVCSSAAAVWSTPRLRASLAWVVLVHPCARPICPRGAGFRAICAARKSCVLMCDDMA